MTGATTDPPAGMPIPTYYLGICDICRVVGEFPTARTRDLWERNHPHNEGEE